MSNTTSYYPAVINLSYGGSPGSHSPYLGKALQGAMSLGVLASIAAGNSETDSCSLFPADSYFGVTVGASNSEPGISSQGESGSLGVAHSSAFTGMRSHTALLPHPCSS